MATQLFLVIKGPRDAAEHAIRKHNVEATIEAVSTNGNEVYAYAPINDKSRVIDWYSKDAGWGGNFEPGSCLWYTERS